jgi:cathepsin L
MSNFLKFLGFFATLAVVANSQIFHQDSSVIERFKNWVDTHRIQANDDHHLAHMFENWLDNDKFIFETNAKNLTYTVGHNAFSGMNSDEFAEFMGFRANQELLAKGSRFLRGSVPTVEQGDVMDLESLPSSIDWRSKGVVSDIRNQFQCGSCWAFSGTSTLESAVAIKTGHLYDLSEQQSVSCAGLRYGNLGCNGGYYSGLWDFSKDNNGICSEANYPYTSGNGDTGSCIKGCTPVSGTKVQSYVDVTPKSDSAMMTGLTVGPLSIAIEADQRSYQMYLSGIYNDYEGCNSNSKTKGADSQPNIDHAVVLVGYGTENGQDYYILRNSWGTSWGEGGYMRISRNSEKYAPWGVCGVLYDPMYPVV